MLTEAIQSLVDTGDQVLLLMGQKRGARPPDARHPLGHGMETYFWSFIVFLVFHRRSYGLPLGRRECCRSMKACAISLRPPWIGIAVLSIAAAFEGTSLRIAYRAYRPWTAHPPVGLHHRIEDPALFSVLLEDSVALIGI